MLRYVLHGMSERQLIGTVTADWVSISLEDGADEMECDPRALEISKRGMRFSSRWAFEIGTELDLTLHSVRGNPFSGSGGKVTATALVVHSHEVSCGCHETTLLFTEVRTGGAPLDEPAEAWG